jgi:hypothetical protein
MTVSALKVSRQPRRKAPTTLSEPAAVWWRALVHEYNISDPAGELLLGEALAAWDRTQQAEALINRDGPVPGGRPVQHPAVAIARDSRAAFYAGIKSLNLDLEPLRDGPGRPPGR